MQNLHQKYFETFLYTPKLTVSNVVSRTIKFMQWVQDLDGVETGPQKKAVVMQLIRDLTDDGDDTTLSVFEQLVPPLIDNIIAVDQKNIRIRRKFTSCFPCRSG